MSLVSHALQGVQTRRFTYDNRGFLLWEEHPELGSFGNGRVTYSRYDARGNAGRKNDGRSDLAFTYDPAERLVTVSEASGARRPLKRFAYAGQNLGGDYRKGKLLSAKRTNWVINPSVPQIGEIPIEVTELYRYQSTSGRVSSRTTSTNIANMPQFTVAYQYNSLGGSSGLMVGSV